MSKCRGKYCKNCVEEWCGVVLDWDLGDEFDVNEEDVIEGEVWMVDGVLCFDEFGRVRDMKSGYDYYESEWRK